MATQVNIFADQGSDYSLDVTVKEDDGTATDLTSFTLSAKFTKNYGQVGVRRCLLLLIQYRRS